MLSGFYLRKWLDGGWLIGYGIGDTVGPLRPILAEEAYEILKGFSGMAGAPAGDLTGFTLFSVPKGWQMSVRLKDELGWRVRIISQEEAAAIFETLERGGHPIHPDKRPAVATVGLRDVFERNAASFTALAEAFETFARSLLPEPVPEDAPL